MCFRTTAVNQSVSIITRHSDQRDAISQSFCQTPTYRVETAQVLGNRQFIQLAQPASPFMTWLPDFTFSPGLQKPLKFILKVYFLLGAHILGKYKCLCILFCRHLQNVSCLRMTTPFHQGVAALVTASSHKETAGSYPTLQEALLLRLSCLFF